MKKHLQNEIKQLAEQVAASTGAIATSAIKNKLYELLEKVTVLEYFENQVSDTQLKNAVSLDSKSYREDNWFKDPQPVPPSNHKEDLAEPLIEKIKDIVAQMPPESRKIDELLEEIIPKEKYVKNDLEEFASNYQEMPTFKRKAETPQRKEPLYKEKEPTKGIDVTKTNKLVEDIGLSEKPKSINDTINTNLQIGLNDRLAFIKHLFNGNTNDYTRVLSQINTLTTFDTAQDFIKNQVKPDYNNWTDKEEYADRFIAIVEKRFN